MLVRSSVKKSPYSWTSCTNNFAHKPCPQVSRTARNGSVLSDTAIGRRWRVKVPHVQTILPEKVTSAFSELSHRTVRYAEASTAGIGQNAPAIGEIRWMYTGAHL